MLGGQNCEGEEQRDLQNEEWTCVRAVRKFRTKKQGGL